MFRRRYCFDESLLERWVQTDSRSHKAAGIPTKERSFKPPPEQARELVARFGHSGRVGATISPSLVATWPWPCAPAFCEKRPVPPQQWSVAVMANPRAWFGSVVLCLATEGGLGVRTGADFLRGAYPSAGLVNGNLRCHSSHQPGIFTRQRQSPVSLQT